MTVVVFVDGPLKGQGREYPDLPKQVLQPVDPHPRNTPTWVERARYELLYEYEVDQEPFADAGTDEGTEPVYEARQVMMWVIPNGLRDPAWAYEFRPNHGTFTELERQRQQPIDEARLDELMEKLDALLDEYGAVIYAGDYAASDAHVELGWASREIGR